MLTAITVGDIVNCILSLGVVWLIITIALTIFAVGTNFVLQTKYSSINLNVYKELKNSASFAGGYSSFNNSTGSKLGFGHGNLEIYLELR